MENQTTEATNRANQAFSAASDLFWDSWMQSVGMMAWAGEQAEKMVGTWMEQGRVSREEGLRLQREMVEQARRNQTELQNLIAKTVQEQTETFRTTMQQQMDDLRRRIDEMNAELRSYRERMGS
jgi:polyhydroxyalkanoate synthesis regulator phasin